MFEARGVRLCSTLLMAAVPLLSCTVDGGDSGTGTASVDTATAPAADPPAAPPDTASEPQTAATDTTDGTVETVPPATCGALGDYWSLEADLDGDGDLQQLGVGRDDAGVWVLETCNQDTRVVYDTGAANKPIEVVPIDVEGDGTTELLVGATTGTAAFVGDLMWLDGDRFEAAGYHIAVQYPLGDRPGESFGCVDSDEDGSRELIRLEYRQDGNEVAWSRSRYDGGPIEPAEGRFRSPEDDTLIQILGDGTCGDDTLIAARG